MKSLIASVCFLTTSDFGTFSISPGIMRFPLIFSPRVPRRDAATVTASVIAFLVAAVFLSSFGFLNVS